MELIIRLRKTKIELSPHYKEIVQLLLKGHSFQSISDHLKEEYNESIGTTALFNFKKKYLNIPEEVKARQLAERKKAAREAREKQLKEFHDELIDEQAMAEADVAILKEEAVDKLTEALQVLEFFFGTYGEESIIGLMEDAEVKYDSKVNLLLRAIKYYLDFHKDGRSEVNVNVPSFYELLNEDLLVELSDDEYDGDGRPVENNSK